MTDLVSVIIINWNGMRWLKRCLDSLSNQTYSKFEIIFVDNASTDESVHYVRKYYPEVKVLLNHRNLGFARGNNLGIQLAQGEYILLLNNDTWVESSFIEDLVIQKIQQNKDVVAPTEVPYDKHSNEVCGSVSLIDPLGHPVYLPASQKKQKSFFLTGVAILFSKSLYEESKGLDDAFFMYCEEIDWFWRLNLLEKSFGYVSNVFVYHYGAGSQKENKGLRYDSFLWRNQNNLQMLLKNYAIHNLLWILPLYILQNFFEIGIFLLLLKPRISASYLEGWWFNIKNIRGIIAKRQSIQKNRRINDRSIFKQMYLGSGKFHHLLQYFQSR